MHACMHVCVCVCVEKEGQSMHNDCMRLCVRLCAALQVARLHTPTYNVTVLPSAMSIKHYENFTNSSTAGNLVGNYTLTFF